MCVKFRSTGVSAKHDGPFACRQMSLTLHVIRVSWCLPLVRGFYLLLFWNRWTSAHYAFWNWSPRYLARTFESRREKAHPRSLIRARCSQEAFVFCRLSKEQTYVFSLVWIRWTGWLICLLSGGPRSGFLETQISFILVVLSRPVIKNFG